MNYDVNTYRLATILEANPPEVLPLLAEAVLETPATGNAEADLNTLYNNAEALFGRKLLRY